MKQTTRRRKMKEMMYFISLLLYVVVITVFFVKAKTQNNEEAQTQSEVEVVATSETTDEVANDVTSETTSAEVTAVEEFTMVAEPEEVYVSEDTVLKEEVPEEVTTYVEGMAISEEERFILEQIVFAEAGEISPEAQRGVAWVIFNRMKSDRYPDNVEDVVFAENQFSPTEGDKIFYWYWPDNTQSYYCEVTEDVITDEVRQSVEEAINGDNPVENMTGFYSKKWISDEERALREQFNDVIIIDDLVFHGDWTEE